MIVPVTDWSGWAVSAGSAGRVGWAQPPAWGQTEGSDLHYLQDTSAEMERHGDNKQTSLGLVFHNNCKIIDYV